MAEDRYRLEPVRGARERVETVRRGELATAIGDASVTEAGLAHARARVTAAREKLAAAASARSDWARSHGARRGPASDTRVADLVRAERFIARCRADLEAARDAELRAQTAHERRADVVDLARATLVRARADREVIERHFARWRETQRKLAERRED